MPLEIKHHIVPHLKGLNSGIEPLTSCGRGSTFTMHHTTLKSAHFLSYTGQAAVLYEHSCMSRQFIKLPVVSVS